MSIFSSGCDLYDHISCEKMYHLTSEELQELKNKTPEEKYQWSLTFNNDRGIDEWNIGISDELECFKIFKQKTNATIYQNYKIKVDEYNQEFVASRCKDFVIIPHEEVIEDKRLKEGKKTKTTYTYKYFGKEYTLKEFNKKDVWVEIPIHFETLLDLIPYYNYKVLMAYNDDKDEHVVISQQSIPDQEFKVGIQAGYERIVTALDKKGLQNHYIEVVQRYFNYEKRTHTLELEVINDLSNKKLVVVTPFSIDEFAPIDVVNSSYPIYLYPKRLSDRTIDVTNVWPIDLSVGDKITLSIVESLPDQLYLC